jgi:hypothetical protein
MKLTPIHTNIRPAHVINQNEQKAGLLGRSGIQPTT